MRARSRNLKQRATVTVSIDASDLEAVDNAAEALDETRSRFIQRAALEKARRIIAQRGRSAAHTDGAAA